MTLAGWFDPITRKRLQRFRESKRAYYSLLTIVFLYITSLGAELFCNDRPLYVRYEDKSYFPVLFFYPEDTFTGNGLLTRADYQAINASAMFNENPGNYMLFPLLPFGPQEIIKASSIPVDNQVEILVQWNPGLLRSISILISSYAVSAGLSGFSKVPIHPLRGWIFSATMPFLKVLSKPLRYGLPIYRRRPMHIHFRKLRTRNRLLSVSLPTSRVAGIRKPSGCCCGKPSVKP